MRCGKPRAVCLVQTALLDATDELSRVLRRQQLGSVYTLCARMIGGKGKVLRPFSIARSTDFLLARANGLLELLLDR